MPPNHVGYFIEIFLIVMCLTPNNLGHLEWVSFVNVPGVEVIKFSLNLAIVFLIIYLELKLFFG